MSDIYSQYKQWKIDARNSLAYKVGRAQSEFAFKLESFLSRRKKSRKQLATDIGTSPAYITKALSGDANFTIETMVKMVEALDAELHISVRPKEIQLVRTWAKADTKHLQSSDDRKTALKAISMVRRIHEGRNVAA